jgi:hypothetical protein
MVFVMFLDNYLLFLMFKSPKTAGFYNGITGLNRVEVTQLKVEDDDSFNIFFINTDLINSA